MTYPMQKTACKKHILIYIYDLRPPDTPILLVPELRPRGTHNGPEVRKLSH